MSRSPEFIGHLGATMMKPDHLHIRVADIDETTHWFDTFLGMQPNYRDVTKAMYPFGN